MKKLIVIFISFTMMIFMGSCVGTKQVTYFQNIDSINLATNNGLYDAKIMPKDLLTITVNTTNEEASKPFNLHFDNQNYGGSNSINNYGYLVDNSGNINFPVVGKIHVVGLTKGECEDLIKEKIKPYMAATENPVITVRMASYRVTVIGEVGGPRVIPVTTEKMSIVEALAQAGDLSIYGKRNNILLIREDAQGNKSAHRLNIMDANILNSPYYYLQQNDIIYVEPNSVKVTNSSIGTSTSLWVGLTTSLLSLAALIVSILKN
ncbi:MAG: polysaccharide biosynthesis/export family protein [Prevotella sp.]|jgi:polysaccharide export outer membrane protein